MSEKKTVDARVFIFDTSHHAMWAEDVAEDNAIPAEVVPAPPDADAKCGLALRVPEDRAEELRTAFDGEGVPYRELEAG